MNDKGPTPSFEEREDRTIFRPMPPPRPSPAASPLPGGEQRPPSPQAGEPQGPAEVKVSPAEIEGPSPAEVQAPSLAQDQAQAAAKDDLVPAQDANDKTHIVANDRARPAGFQPAYVEEATVFRPNPGGRRPLIAPAAQTKKSPVPPPRQSAVQGPDLRAPNANPIMQAASPLLLLLGRLRAALLRTSGPGLTQQIAASIEKSERDMRAVGVAPEDVEAAKYVLCATADEVIANLPDEDRNKASQSGFMTRFFGENDGGLRFFDELDRLKQNAKAHDNLLELFHACLALGFQGGRQTLPGGAATLQDLRHELRELLQKYSPAPRELSPNWEGQPLASHAVGLRVPLWTALGVVGVILFGNYVGLRILLGHRAEAAAQSLIGLNPQTPVEIGRKLAVAPPPPPPPSPAQASQLDHIRKVLEPNIAAGALGVESTANQIVIHITDRTLFQPGKAMVLDDVRPLMMYIALALDDEKGVIKVVGHSDNTPISNARFASNFELSLERAKAVGALLKQALSHPERIEVEGKGADVPIASNDTVEGRNKNRRVEIVIPRSD